VTIRRYGVKMLIGTGDVRTWLALPDEDTRPNEKISSLIKAVQEFCDNYTGRKLEAATYGSTANESINLIDGTGKSWVYVPNPPISMISSVSVDSDRGFGAGTLVPTGDVYFYPKSGKIVSEGGSFISGHRNVNIHYNGGYAPVKGGTHDNAVSTYPIPYDLQQTMVEMVSQSMKEGVTMIHSVESEDKPTFVQMLTQNSFWRNTLNRYKMYVVGLDAREE